MVKDPKSAFRGLECFYSFKEINAPTYHLGMDYYHTVDSTGKTLYQLGSATYMKEALVKIKDLTKNEMGISLGHPKSFPMNTTW
jgi:hypothetical protein